MRKGLRLEKIMKLHLNYLFVSLYLIVKLFPIQVTSEPSGASITLSATSAAPSKCCLHPEDHVSYIIP